MGVSLTHTGDKSNHIVTLHLPQMLYLWPFIAFFSFPLILPSALSLLHSLISVLQVLVSPSPIPKWPTVRKLLLTLTYTSIALTATLLIIHYNTIIHPFTLADNR